MMNEKQYLEIENEVEILGVFFRFEGLCRNSLYKNTKELKDLAILFLIDYNFNKNQT